MDWSLYISHAKIKKAVWFIFHGYRTLSPPKPYHKKANMFVHNREVVLRQSAQRNRSPEGLWSFINVIFINTCNRQQCRYGKLTLTHANAHMKKKP
jgi:hypothetical protein